MNKFMIIGLSLGLLLGVFLGSLLPRGVDDSAAASMATDWTCSMHPQVSLPEKGLCPICEMDLIPRSSMSSSGEPNVVHLDEHAKMLAKIETQKVVASEAIHQIRLSGHIERDETRVRVVTILGSGRLERLYANYIGMQVKKGQHLAEVFSPEFSSAAAELIAGEKVLDANHSIKQAAVKKLKLLGVSDGEIKNIATHKTVPASYTLFSPVDGIITSSIGHEGEWFKSGAKLFEIVDLTSVWSVLDVYESQLEMIHYGQSVQITVSSFPGRIWEGQVSFIDPQVQSKSRSLGIRVQLDNADLVLRPAMLAKASVDVQFDAQGRVMKPHLAGKWISPMHPEVIRDEPGQCPVCGMDLITSEEYVKKQETSAAEVLQIPVQAPLLFGDKALVYVEEEPNHFKPRLVELGHRVNNSYIVLKGLKAGEHIVKRGAFRIDSDLQIQAGDSMMHQWQTVEKHEEMKDALSDEMKSHLRPGLRQVFEGWLQMQERLSQGDTSTLETHLQELGQLLNKVPHADAVELIVSARKAIEQAREKAPLALLEDDSDIVAPFLANFSESLIALQALIGFGTNSEWDVKYCPMVPREGGEEGARWLQKTGKLWNPFFFGGMKHCGSHKEQIHDH